jgi:hypothetical protein
MLVKEYIGSRKNGFLFETSGGFAYVSAQYHAGQLALYPERDGTRVGGLSHISTFP